MLLMMCVIGLALNIIGLPGLWLMVASAVAFAWWTGFVYLGWPGLITLVVLALLAELVEFLAGSAGAKAAGGSKRGMVGAIVGGLVGGLVGTAVIPIPAVGTIIGAVAGSFGGAALVEYSIGRTMEHSYQVGVGAAKGRFWGIVSKTGFGLAMLAVVIIAGIPLGGRAAGPALPATPGPATLPVTQPTTEHTEPGTQPATDMAPAAS